jgi:SAM-dependent methyltransferase
MKFFLISYWRRFVASFLVFTFLISIGIGPQASVLAQEILLPPAGSRLGLSPPFTPPLLKGIKLHSDNPFRLDFILDKGDIPQTSQHATSYPIPAAGYGLPATSSNALLPTTSNSGLKDASARLIKYFLAALTVPENDLWVNLSPYEKNRIIPDAFGVTEMGRDLLAQDYILKQITASVIYPEEKTGREFWAKVYAEAQKRYGTTDIPIDTFNKVWIVPEKATVYENQDAAFVIENKLKVMLDNDYLATTQSSHNPATYDLRTTTSSSADIAKDVLREVIIPILEKEVNEGKNFAQLRQIYHSLILAVWFKGKIKESVLGQAYVDKNKTGGVDIEDKAAKERIWAQYVESFKKGAYSLIKEETDPATGQTIPRKYFSGGFWGGGIRQAIHLTHDPGQLPLGISTASVVLKTGFDPVPGTAGRESPAVSSDPAMKENRANARIRQSIDNVYIHLYEVLDKARRKRRDIVIKESMPVEYGKFELTFPEVVDELLRFFDLKPGARIFDFGCGDGWLAYRLAARGFFVDGMEMEEDPFLVYFLAMRYFLQNLASGKFSTVLDDDAVRELMAIVSRVDLKKGNIFISGLDFSKYDAVYLYYPEPHGNRGEFLSNLAEEMRKAGTGLNKGARLIILRQGAFDPVAMEGLQLVKHKTFPTTSNPTVKECTLYEYVVSDGSVDGPVEQVLSISQADPAMAENSRPRDVSRAEVFSAEYVQKAGALNDPKLAVVLTDEGFIQETLLNLELPGNGSPWADLEVEKLNTRNKTGYRVTLTNAMGIKATFAVYRFFTRMAEGYAAADRLREEDPALDLFPRVGARRDAGSGREWMSVEYIHLPESYLTSGGAEAKQKVDEARIAAIFRMLALGYTLNDLGPHQTAASLWQGRVRGVVLDLDGFEPVEDSEHLSRHVSRIFMEGTFHARDIISIGARFISPEDILLGYARARAPYFKNDFLYDASRDPVSPNELLGRLGHPVLDVQRLLEGMAGKYHFFDGDYVAQVLQVSGLDAGGRALLERIAEEAASSHEIDIHKNDMISFARRALGQETVFRPHWTARSISGDPAMGGWTHSRFYHSASGTVYIYARYDPETQRTEYASEGIWHERTHSQAVSGFWARERRPGNFTEDYDAWNVVLRMRSGDLELVAGSIDSAMETYDTDQEVPLKFTESYLAKARALDDQGLAAVLTDAGFIQGTLDNLRLANDGSAWSEVEVQNFFLMNKTGYRVTLRNRNQVDSVFVLYYLDKRMADNYVSAARLMKDDPALDIFPYIGARRDAGERKDWLSVEYIHVPESYFEEGGAVARTKVTEARLTSIFRMLAGGRTISDLGPHQTAATLFQGRVRGVVLDLDNFETISSSTYLVYSLAKIFRQRYFRVGDILRIGAGFFPPELLILGYARALSRAFAFEFDREGLPEKITAEEIMASLAAPALDAKKLLAGLAGSVHFSFNYQLVFDALIASGIEGTKKALLESIVGDADGQWGSDVVLLARKVLEVDAVRYSLGMSRTAGSDPVMKEPGRTSGQDSSFVVQGTTPSPDPDAAQTAGVEFAASYLEKTQALNDPKLAAILTDAEFIRETLEKLELLYDGSLLTGVQVDDLNLRSKTGYQITLRSASQPEMTFVLYHLIQIKAEGYTAAARLMAEDPDLDIFPHVGAQKESDGGMRWLSVEYMNLPSRYIWGDEREVAEEAKLTAVFKMLAKGYTISDLRQDQTAATLNQNRVRGVVLDLDLFRSLEGPQDLTRFVARVFERGYFYYADPDIIRSASRFIPPENILLGYARAQMSIFRGIGSFAGQEGGIPVADFLEMLGSPSWDVERLFNGMANDQEHFNGTYIASVLMARGIDSRGRGVLERIFREGADAHGIDAVRLAQKVLEHGAGPAGIPPDPLAREDAAMTADMSGNQLSAADKTRIAQLKSPEIGQYLFEFPLTIFSDRDVDLSSDDRIRAHLARLRIFHLISAEHQEKVFQAAKSLLPLVPYIRAYVEGLGYEPVNISFFGSYLWNETPNDLDVLIVVKGKVLRSVDLLSLEVLGARDVALAKAVEKISLHMMGQEALEEDVRPELIDMPDTKEAQWFIDAMRERTKLVQFDVWGREFTETPHQFRNSLVVISRLLFSVWERLNDTFFKKKPEDERFRKAIKRLVVAVTLLEYLKGKRVLSEIQRRRFFEIGENAHPSLDDKRFVIQSYEFVHEAYQVFLNQVQEEAVSTDLLPVAEQAALLKKDLSGESGADKAMDVVDDELEAVDMPDSARSAPEGGEARQPGEDRAMTDHHPMSPGRKVLLRSWEYAPEASVEKIMEVLRSLDLYRKYILLDIYKIAMFPGEGFSFFGKRGWEHDVPARDRVVLFNQQGRLRPLARQVILQAVREDWTQYGDFRLETPYTDLPVPDFVRTLATPLTWPVEKQIAAEIIPRLEVVVQKKMADGMIMVVEGLPSAGKTSLGKYIQKNGIAGIAPKAIQWFDLDRYVLPGVPESGGYLLTDDGRLLEGGWGRAVNMRQFGSDVRWALHGGKKLVVVTGFSAARFFKEAWIDQKPAIRVVLQEADHEIMKRWKNLGRDLDLEVMKRSYERESGIWKDVPVDLYLDLTRQAGEGSATTVVSRPNDGPPDREIAGPVMAEVAPASDRAMVPKNSNNTGGIDLTSDKLGPAFQSTGMGVQYKFDAAMIGRLEKSSGLAPVIIDIQPLTTSVQVFLGAV